LTGSESGLVGYWQLNEGSGSTTTNDQTGHGYTGTLTNFQFDANDGQLPSTVSVGAGTSVSQDNFQTGIATLGTVSLSMVDDFDNPVTVVGTQINSSPNIVPSTSGVNLVDRYWVINSHGTPGTFSTNLTFTVPASYTHNGSESGSVYTLYHRDGNSDGAWTTAVSGAASVTATTLTFNGDTSFSQFFIGSSDGSLPVELASFVATTTNSTATLQWGTATETNNYGFEVEKRKTGETGDGRWTKVGFVAGNGTSSSVHQYSFTDGNVASGTYAYRLKQIDNSGTFKYSNEAEVTITVQTVFALNQNYPNPFNPSTAITFTLAQDGYTTLKVYDILGREVVTLVNGEMKAGVQNSVTFDASKLSSGIYFSRLESSGQVQMKRMIVIK
jgi:hypothetical protein